MAPRKKTDITQQVKADLENSPASSFFTIAEEEHDNAQGAPIEYKRGFGEKLPEGRKKDHRTTLLFRTGQWEDLRILARIRRTTPNAIINDYVEQLLEENADLISKFRQLLKETGEE